MPDTLRVNPITCSGHGVCAELLPELISLDEWGYPIVDPHPVPPALALEARRAVAACPALALKLTRAAEVPERAPRPVRTLLTPGGRPPEPPEKPR